MSDSLYITANEARSGKTAVCLGVMEMLCRRIDRVGFFRPFVDIDQTYSMLDNDINLMASVFHLDTSYRDMFAFSTTQAGRLISHGRESEVIDGVLTKFDQLRKHFDLVLCEGTDYEAFNLPFEFDINAEIAKNLGAPVLLVANADGRPAEDTVMSVESTIKSLKDKGCTVIGTVVNRIEPDQTEVMARTLEQHQAISKLDTFLVPANPFLGYPTMVEVVRQINGEVLFGAGQLGRHVHKFTVAAMQLRNFLPRIEQGNLIITPGDRADVIVSCLASVSSQSMPNIAGLVLSGGLIPEEPIQKLIQGFSSMVPIISVKEDTFPAARKLDQVKTDITPDNERKIHRALAHFEKHVDTEALGQKIITTHSATVTPKMFEYGLIQKARQNKQHIVLPEGTEERILRASEILLRRGVVDLTLLGPRREIEEKANALSLRLEGASLINPMEYDQIEDFIDTYYELRKHKGLTRDRARDTMYEPNYFGTMMVYKGLADGMVSGSTHTTGATILPAFEIIKTKPGITLVSSVFFMCLADRVLVYGDCAVNPNPNANQLAMIALSSAHTAQTFGVEPCVAMLSYSTGESGHGADVDLVREAVTLAKGMAKECWPDLKLEGPMQYDAAVDASVAKTKMPDSEVAGRATVFIFPDLNTGNNTYKAVQRSAGAVAVGPVLQGLKAPVNDLSRGCLVPDIVNTVAITAIQAQAEKEPA